MHYYRIYQYDCHEVFSNSTSNWQTRYVRNTNDFPFSAFCRLFRNTFAGVIRVDNTTIEMYFLIYFPLYSIKGDEKSIVETFDITKWQSFRAIDNRINECAWHICHVDDHDHDHRRYAMFEMKEKLMFTISVCLHLIVIVIVHQILAINAFRL